MKTTSKNAERNRLIVLSFFTAFVFVLFMVILMIYQIVNGADYNAQTVRTSTTSLSIKAARGEILDRNGEPIAENKTGYNIVFLYSFLPKAQQNDIIARLITLCEKNGEKYQDVLPINSSSPWEFLPDQESLVETLKEAVGVNVYATAENCMYYLTETKYQISGYNDTMTRKIAGVRYSMERAQFSINNNQYVFAQGVSVETVLKLKELSRQFPGVEIVEEDLRTYPSGDLLPHIVGTIGAMDAEEYYGTEERSGYQELGYPMNAEVGKFGIEQLMETTLHGKNGVKTVEMNKSGEIINEEITAAPESGNDVVLTISLAFQQKVQELLANHIEFLQNQTAPKASGTECESGAIVVLDAQTGGVLAMVSYPSYDINLFFSNYSEYLADERKPLTNRALSGLYRPGSTFKTAVAIAGLEEGIISPTSLNRCTGTYYYYDTIIPGNTFRPSCLGVHGNIGVAQALTVSCNIFFYETGRLLGINRINKYATLLGLGTDTGIELSSTSGALSGPERSEALGSEWFQGNVVQAAIGQMDTSVTPLQLAVQAMTIANRGTRYRAHLIEEIRSYDGSEILSKTEPEILSSFEISDQNYQAVVQGMLGAAARVNQQYSLTNLDYQVAIKTGTPQQTNDIFNSTVVAFAPVDEPKIAIGIVLEEGDYSSYLIRQILDAYEEVFDPIVSSAVE